MTSDSSGEAASTTRVPLVRRRPAVAGVLLLLLGAGAFTLYAFRDDDLPHLKLLMIGVVGTVAGVGSLIYALVRAARR